MEYDSGPYKLLEYSRLFNINFTEIRTLYLWGFPRKGYGLWVIEVLWGLWFAFPCEPTRWTEKSMGYMGVWVMRAMAYERVDCII